MAEPLLPAHASDADSAGDRSYPSEAGDLDDVHMRQDIPFQTPVPGDRLTAAELVEHTAEAGAATDSE